ncbi:hypothetical protein KKG72_01330 [bacterium]|nr:hypothetical protein [bacterium]
MKSKFTALENQFLNTFFSGIYISANEFIQLGSKLGIKMGMNSRELLIKELLNKSDENGTLNQCAALLHTLIQSRIDKYHSLSRDYTGSSQMLSKLAAKANNTKSLLLREVQRSPYE